MADLRNGFVRKPNGGSAIWPDQSRAAFILSAEFFGGRQPLDATASVSFDITVTAEARFGSFTNSIYLGGLSFGPISSAPISSSPDVAASVPLVATATVSWGAFTLAAEATRTGNLITGSVSWGAFTLTALAELETEANASLTWDAFTLEASLDNRIDVELSANWDPFTLNAFTEYKFRFTRPPATPGTITRPLSTLPASITRNGSITRETRITI